MTGLPRRQAREVAFQFLYGNLPDPVPSAEGQSTPPFIFTKIEFQHFCVNFKYTYDEFSWEIVEGTGKNLPMLDRSIAVQSSRWRIERMPRVDLTILRMASFEILINKKRDVPKTVAINEAIELSKRFGSEDSAAFVNGVLDHVDKVEPTP